MAGGGRDVEPGTRGQWYRIVVVCLSAAATSFVTYWGNLVTYTASYIGQRHGYSDSGGEMAPWVMPLWVFGTCIGFFFTGHLVKKIGNRFTLLGGILFQNIGIASVYFLMNASASMFLISVNLGLVNGVGSGCVQIITMQSLIGWAGQRSGLFLGVHRGSIGLGGVLVNQLLTSFINPNNDSPDLRVGSLKVFSQPYITEKIPITYLSLGAACFIVQILSIPAVCPHPMQGKMDEMEIMDTSTGERRDLTEKDSISMESGAKSSLHYGAMNQDLNNDTTPRHANNELFRAGMIFSENDNEINACVEYISTENNTCGKNGACSGTAVSHCAIDDGWSATTTTRVMDKDNTSSATRVSCNEVEHSSSNTTTTTTNNKNKNNTTNNNNISKNATKGLSSYFDLSPSSSSSCPSLSLSSSSSSSLTPKQILRTTQYQVFLTCMILAGGSFHASSNYFKFYGQLWIPDDQYLVTVWTIYLLTFVFSSSAWGLLIDRFRVKYCLMVYFATQPVITVFFYFSPLISFWNKATFCIAVVVYGVFGAPYWVVFSGSINKTFGKKNFSVNYGMVTLPCGMAGLFIPVLLESILGSLGWFFVFGFAAFASFIGFLIIIVLFPR